MDQNQDQDEVKKTVKSRRGFAAMDPKLARELARRGGKAAHAAGTAHRWTKEEAREMGAKGGRTPRKSRRNVLASEASSE